MLHSPKAIDFTEHLFYIKREVIKMRKVCEVLSFFKDGNIYPVKFRYYAVDKATYYTVDVDKVRYIKIKNCNGLKEKTYHITGSRNRLKGEYELYLDPRSKTWWVI